MNNQPTEVSEQRKTEQQRAEDIAYTINHSLYCTLTDFLNPPIDAVEKPRHASNTTAPI